MPHAFDRRIRVADLIKQQLANLLLTESHDPRFSFVSITGVELAKDYSVAKVFVTLLNEVEADEILRALNKAADFFRYKLAHSVNLRTTPKLFFRYDETLRQGQKISELLQKSHSKE